MHKILRSIVVMILTWEAKRVLRKWKPKIILVSGSVGKTTTKDAIYHALKERMQVRKSQKSFNSEIGVPLTILGLPNVWRSPRGWIENIREGYRLTNSEKAYPKVLVLEVGSDHPGDIRSLLSWLHPDIAVLTSLPDVPVHVENFASPEAVRLEDSLVVSALASGGVYIANLDDAAQSDVIASALKNHTRVLSYGFETGAIVRGREPHIRYAMNEGVQSPVGMEFIATVEGEDYVVYVNEVLGVPVCAAVLAAIAVGVALEEPVSLLSNAVMSFGPPPGRMRIVNGRASSTIIDDSYNSSPIALEVALSTLKNIEAKRKLAVLGDMLELGSFSDAEHWQAGRQAGEFVDELVTVGKRARFIAEAAKSAGLPEGHIHEFANSEEAGLYVRNILTPGDVVLVKGSQGSGENLIRMERAVRSIMMHPDLAPSTLVRQEAEWQQDYSAGKN